MKTVIQMAIEAGIPLVGLYAGSESTYGKLERFIEIYEREKQREPVAMVIRNEAGQIAMQKPDGSYFDMSKHIGQIFYTAPPNLDQILHDPENQPSQYGTVPMEYLEKTAPNLNCKSVQRRLATSWGYVRKEEYDMARVAAATAMRDAAVRVCREMAHPVGAGMMSDFQWAANGCAEAIAALPILGEEK